MTIQRNTPMNATGPVHPKKRKAASVIWDSAKLDAVMAEMERSVITHCSIPESREAGEILGYHWYQLAECRVPPLRPRKVKPKKRLKG